MPIYNSADYLKKTINSIINQTYQNWELIAIDDCSSDDSYQIVKSFSHQDSRIKVYRNQKNLGICGNRNVGISHATGQYLAFCDDDDLFNPNLLQDNVAILKKNPQIDMLKFGRELISVNNNNQIFKKNATKMEITGLIKGEKKYDKYFLIRQSDILYNLWNGLYRKELLIKEKINFDEEMKYGSEDAKFSYQVYLKSKNIYLNPQIYYYHYKRQISSTSRKFNINKIYSILKTCETEFLIWQNIDFQNLENQYHRIIAINININNIMHNQVFHPHSKLKYQQRKAIYEKIKKQILDKHYLTNKEIIKKLRHNNRKHYIVTKVLSLKNYYFIDIFYKLSAKIKNRKWK